REPGQALLVHDGGDAQPGALHQVALERPEPGGAGVGVDRAGAVGAGEVAEAVAGELGQARDAGELALQRCDRLAVLLLPEADDLGELLLQRVEDAGLVSLSRTCLLRRGGWRRRANLGHEVVLLSL